MGMFEWILLFIVIIFLFLMMDPINQESIEEALDLPKDAEPDTMADSQDDMHLAEVTAKSSHDDFART